MNTLSIHSILPRNTQKREKFSKRSSWVAAITVASVLTILGGSPSAYAGENPENPSVSAPTKEAINIAPSKVSMPSIQEVFSDILHDHPRQKGVTIEQAVRRIEGYKQGIVLSQSEKLHTLNFSVSHMVHSPNGKIASAMRELGYLSESEKVDTAARKMTSEKIQAVLEKTYGIPDEIPWNIEPSGVSEKPSVQPVIPVSPVILEGIPVQEEGIFEKILGATALVGTGILGYIFSRRRHVKKLSTPIAPQGLLDTTIPKRPPRIPLLPVKEVFIPDEVEVPPQEIVVSKESDSIEPLPIISIPEVPTTDMDQKNLELFEWVLFDTTPLIRSEEYCGNYHASTVGGDYSFELSGITDGGIHGTLSWKEGGVTRFKKEIHVTQLDASDNEKQFSHLLEEALRKGFYEAFLERELLAQKRAREIDTFEISQKDVVAMFRQCETPDAINGNETWGFWFQNLYDLKGKTLRFRNLVNPRSDEIDASAGDFGIKPEKQAEYCLRGIDLAMAEFSPKERNLLFDWHDTIKSQYRSKDGPSGLMDTYNWHKHPGGPEGPSSMDIDFWHGTSLSHSPFRQVATWGIVNRIDQIPEHIPENMLLLDGKHIGRSYGYKITFWKLLKLSKSELERRRSIITEVGIPAAIRAGISDRNGNPIRILRPVTIGRYRINSDLQAIKTRMVP